MTTNGSPDIDAYFTLPPDERLAAAQAAGGPTLDEVLSFIATADPDQQMLIRRVDMRRRSELCAPTRDAATA